MHRLISALISARQERGMSLRTLAEAARVNKHWTAWRAVERGERASPILTMLDAAGAALGLRLEWVHIAPELSVPKLEEFGEPVLEELPNCHGCVMGQPLKDGRHYLRNAPTVHWPCTRLAWPAK